MPDNSATFELRIDALAERNEPARARFVRVEGLDGAEDGPRNLVFHVGSAVTEELNGWLEDGVDGLASRHLALVRMLDPDGVEVARWELADALPLSFIGTDDGDRDRLEKLVLRVNEVAMVPVPALQEGEDDALTEVGTEGPTQLGDRANRQNLPYRIELYSVKGLEPAKGAFASCTGLPRDPREREQSRGDDPTEILTDQYQSPLARQFASGEITLSHGGFDDLETWAWLTRAQKSTGRGRLAVTATLRLLSDDGHVRMEWTLFNAWPMRFEGPGLDELTNDIVLDDLTLVHGGGNIDKGDLFSC